MGREAKRKSVSCVERRRSSRLQSKTTTPFDPHMVYYSSAVSTPASCHTFPSRCEEVSPLCTPPVLYRWKTVSSFSPRQLVSAKDNASGKSLVVDLQRQLLTYARRSEGKESPVLVNPPVANFSRTESQEEKFNPRALVAVPVEECGVSSTAQEAKGKAVWAANADITPKMSACNSKTHGDPPMQCMALSEKICMWAKDDADEVSSGELVEICGYKVKERCIPILTKIFDKHGNIASNCFLVTSKARSALLIELCSVVANFQGKSFHEIPLTEIEEALALIDDFKKAGLVVDWFYESLKKAAHIKELIKRYPDLMSQREKTAEAIKDKQRELEGYRAQIAALQEKQRSVQYELELAKAEASRISKKMSDAKAEVSKYTSKPLMDLL